MLPRLGLSHASTGGSPGLVALLAARASVSPALLSPWRGGWVPTEGSVGSGSPSPLCPLCPSCRRGRGGAERRRLPALALLPPGRAGELQHAPQRAALLPQRPARPPGPTGERGRPRWLRVRAANGPGAWAPVPPGGEAPSIPLPNPAESPGSRPALAEVSLCPKGMRRG